MTTQVTAACSPTSFNVPSFSQVIPLGARVDPEPDARDSALACLRIVSLGLSQASLGDSFTLAGWGSFSPLELGTVRKGHGWEWTLGTSRSSTYSVALLINGRLRYGLVMGNRQQSAAPPKRSVLLSSENAVGTRLWQPHY